MGVFTFSISSYFSFARLYISRDLSIYSRSPSLLVYNLSQYSLIIVLFSGVDCDLSSLFCDFIYLVLFCFLVDKAGQGLIHFLSYFEEPVLSFIIPFYCFVVSVLFISALIFIFPFFCRLQALFPIPFPAPLGVVLGCVLESFFLRQACIAMYFPLRTVFATSQRFEETCFHFHLF